jgi:hypothetical protein
VSLPKVNLAADGLTFSVMEDTIMDTESTEQRQPTVQTLDESAPAAESMADFSLRDQRVAEYESIGLEKQDPLEACLAALNADLMRTSFGLGDVVQQALATGPASDETVRRVKGTLDIYLRVTSQVGRFSELEYRASEARYKSTRGDIDMEDLLALHRRSKNASRGIAMPIVGQPGRPK